jgi:hypothetical protein
VTQALNRVRQAARQRKKERFTTLLHHVNVDTLWMGGVQQWASLPRSWTQSGLPTPARDPSLHAPQRPLRRGPSNGEVEWKPGN